jgi:hypothetical protein
MFFNYFYSILTAPGVMVHELAHAFFCLLTGVRIRKISLFRFDKVAGYVIHDEPTGFFSSFLISFGPLIINSYLAMWLFTKVVSPLSWLDILFFWLGAAIALHAIPSTGDAQSLLKNANRNIWRHPLKILFYPLVLILYILNLLKRIYFDIVYVAALYYIAWHYFILYI